MGNPNFAFPGIKKKIGACLVVGLLLVIAILIMSAKEPFAKNQDKAQPAAQRLIQTAGAKNPEPLSLGPTFYIDFSEFPEGTTVTDQYQLLGVVFSGDEYGDPVILGPSAGIHPNTLYGPLILASNGYWGGDRTGPIYVTFVNPVDGSPAEATSLSIAWGYASFLAGVRLTYYDLNGNVVDTPQDFYPTYPYQIIYDPPSKPIHRFSITKITPGSDTVIYMNGLSFQLENLGPQSNLGDPDDCKQKKCCGSPGWSVNKINMNFYVKDTPLWHRSPVGPPVEITLSYNSKAPSAPSAPFGNKWQLNYGSSLVEESNPNSPNWLNVTVCMPDGRRDVYTYDFNTAQTYTTPFLSHNTLSKISPNRFELRLPDDTVYTYDLPGGTSSKNPSLAEIRDPHSQKLSFGYDANANLTTITDALGRVTTLSYNADGLVTAATDSFGRQATFEYDANRNLIGITDMGGYASSFTYDPTTKFITSIANARGAWQFLTESSPNNRITITNPLGFKEEYGYSGGSNPVSWHISPMNYGTSVKTVHHITQISSNIWDNSVISQTDLPVGGSKTSTYDSAGNLASESYDGKTWQYVYNSLGFVTSKTDPNGMVTSMTYAGNNIDLTSITISNRKKTLGTETRTYNGSHDVLSITDRMGCTTNYTYNGYGQVTSVQDALSIVNNYLYDDLHRLTAVTRAGQTIKQNTYDALDRISSHTDASGLTLGYLYNNLDQVTAISYPDGKAKTYQYSTCCPFIVDSITERSGQTTFYSYDQMNHLLAVTDPAGLVTRYGYDANGNRNAIIDPKGNTTSFIYDANNRLTGKTYANGTFETYTYSGVANLVAARTNPRGVTTNYKYTNLEKLARSYDSGNRHKTLTSYSYDDFGRKTSVANRVASLNYTYDNNSRLLSVTGPWKNSTMAYQYDALGRRTALTPDQGLPVTYEYDALNRLTAVSVGGQVYAYGYGGASPLVQSLTRPNSALTSYDYDLLNRLTQKTTAVSGVQINQYGYAYNQQDLRSAETYSGYVPHIYENTLASYTYNNVNELTQSTDPLAQDLGYDASGNLTQGHIPAGDLFTATYDSDNHLLDLTYTDGLGGVNRTVYTYLGDLLIKKQQYWFRSLTEETRYVYDGFRIIQERDANNNVVNEYTYGQGLPGGIGDILQLNQGGAFYFYLYDGMGNVTALLDGTGKVAQSYFYDPFGAYKGASGSIIQPMRFSSKPYDERTGLYYYGYRFYAPGLGRWLTRDPIGEQDNINLYTFVENNPVNHIDQFGLICENQTPATRDSDACKVYGGDETYTSTEYWPIVMTCYLKCFCRVADDSLWSKQVRACLSCMRKHNQDMKCAHKQCYDEADKKYGRNLNLLIMLYNTAKICEVHQSAW